MNVVVLLVIVLRLVKFVFWDITLVAVWWWWWWWRWWWYMICMYSTVMQWRWRHDSCKYTAHNTRLSISILYFALHQTVFLNVPLVMCIYRSTYIYSPDSQFCCICTKYIVEDLRISVGDLRINVCMGCGNQRGGIDTSVVVVDTSGVTTMRP